MHPKQLFPKAMKLICCKLLLTTRWVIIVAAFFPSIALAFTDADMRVIGKEELLEKLKEIHGKDKEFVEGYVIDGRDIIRIIDETDIDIKIKDSTIKGEFNFSELLPSVVGDLKISKDWNVEEWEEWQKKQIKGSPFYQVNNKIWIISSDVHSLLARNTLFNGDVDFSSSTFSGDADFNSASFGSYASFFWTSFEGDY